MLTIRQSARQHQPLCRLCAALFPFPFPRPFPSLHRGLNTSTIGPNTSTLLSAKRRVAHYSPQRIGCSTTSTMIACVDSPHCCSGRVLGVALGLVRSPVHWISCKKLLARPVPSRVWSPTPSATPPPPTGSLLAALLATLPQQRAPLVTCDKKEFPLSHLPTRCPTDHCLTHLLHHSLAASLTCCITLSLHHSLAASRTHLVVPGC